MAGMTTALTEYADNGNSRTYIYTGHSVSDPRLVLQKRKIPSGSGVVAEDVVTVLSGTEGASGAPHQSRVSFSATIRRPIDGVAADVTAALAVFRDIVASDQFASTIVTQGWLK